MKRECASCKHAQGDECRHPQARDLWGRLSGMRRYLSDKSPIWPRVFTDHACGWWRPW